MAVKSHNDDNRVLRAGLTAARGHLLGRSLGEAALWCVLVLAASAVLMLGVELTLYLPAAWRIAVLVLVSASLLGVASWRVARAVLKFGRLERVARVLERFHPGLRDRLSSALEFSGMERARFGESEELMHAAVAQARNLVDSRDKIRELGRPVLGGEHRRSRLALRLSFVCVAAFMLLGSSNPLNVHRALDNYTHPLRLLELERSYHILVQPGDRTILRGDSLSIRAMGTIAKPGEMVLDIWQTGQPAEQVAMDYDPTQFEHTHTLANLQNDIAYCVTQGSVSSDTFKVTVTNNPFITELSLTYHYPAYTGLDSYTTTREKAIQGLRGSRVVLDGRASNPLDSAWVRLDADSLRSAAIYDSRAFSDTLYLASSGSYSILLHDTWGLAGSDTLVYPITVLPDERPAVALRHPKGQADLNEEMVQPLVYELADDFGLRSLVLSWRRVRPSGDEGETQNTLIASWRGADRPAHVLEQYDWDLNGAGLLPEDEVAYRLTVYDNDAVSGPKSSSTAEYRLRFPSIEEIFNREQNRQDQIASDLHELQDQGEDLHEQVKKLNETLERGKELHWEENQQLNQALQEQQKMLDKVKKLSGQLQESLEQMQRSEMMSSEMMEKMAKVQQLMSEVATDKLKELMDQIKQSIEKMNPGALEEAMKKLQLSQEEILQKLDKTLSLLERLKLEQQLDHLVQQTEKLAAAAAAAADSTAPLLDSAQLARADSLAAAAAGQQTGQDSAAAGQAGETQPQAADSSTMNAGAREQAAETTENTSKNEQAGQQQAEPVGEQEKLSKLAESTDEMQEQTGELFEKIDEAVQQFGEAGEQETTANLLSESTPGRRVPMEQQLQQAQEGYQQGRPQQSYQAQRGYQRQMQQMNERMEKYREELQSKWRSEVAEAMKRAFDQLNFLSENQEDVLDGVDEEPDISHPDVLTYAAREQEIVQGIEAVRKEVVEAAKDNFYISSRLLGILYMATSQGEDAADKLSADNRRKDQALASLRRSLTVINAGMLALLDDSDRMQQSSSGTGLDMMMKQLEEMAQRQQQLNRMSRDALNQQQGQGQNSMPGPGTTSRGQGQSSEGLMEMLSRMTAEQEAIRRQLQQMAEQMRGGREGEGQQPLGNAVEGAAKEAEEVVKELKERGISQETLERQNRIFNRLLDAQKSIQERETGRKRKAERPEDFTVTPPDELPAGLLDNGNESDALLRQLERWQGSYPESYRDLIREYYELLRTRRLERK